MSYKICIRKEFKNSWERRAPLTPDAVRHLVSQGLTIHVERSPIRIFPDQAYADAGAVMTNTSDDCDIVLGIKEPPLERVRPGQIHIAFSHTIKGQPYNMGLLQSFLDRGATLLDYELMKDDQGARTIAFGRYAGIAGAVESLNILGKKWALQGKRNVLEEVQQPHHYALIDRLRGHLESLAPRITTEDLRVVIVGTGNVGIGCAEVCQWLGMARLPKKSFRAGEIPPGPWYVSLATSDIVRHIEDKPYDKAEYRKFGAERYQADFERYLGQFNLLLQTPYWVPRYPRQLCLETLRRNHDKLPPVIGDISCDPNGSLALTPRITSIDEPAYTFLVDEATTEPGITVNGPTVMAIDNLPCELSEDATAHFSRILRDMMPAITDIDLTQPLADSGLPRTLQDATIVYKGHLTEPRQKLQKHLDEYHQRQN